MNKKLQKKPSKLRVIEIEGGYVEALVGQGVSSKARVFRGSTLSVDLETIRKLSRILGERVGSLPAPSEVPVLVERPNCYYLTDTHNRVSTLALSGHNFYEKRGKVMESVSSLLALRCLRVRVDSLQKLRALGVGELGHLRRLDLGFCSMLTDLKSVEKLQSLNDLVLKGSGVTDLGPLAKLTHLRRLDLGSCSMLVSLKGVENLHKLEELVLNGSKISDLGPLAKLTHLRRLDLGSCSMLSNLRGVENLQSLEELALNGCRKISNLRPLARLKLHCLDIRNCPNIKLMPEFLNVQTLLKKA